jgi:hypothetical protein
MDKPVLEIHHKTHLFDGGLCAIWGVKVVTGAAVWTRPA